VEWVVPVAVAVGKLLLRASGQVDAADAIGDAQEGWARLRQLRTDGRGDAIGRVIRGQLEQRLVGVTDQGQAQDLRASAEDVASLIGGLANDNEAVRVAAAHPDQFLAYAKQRSDQLRRSTSTAATPLFDRILEAAAAEFVELAPSSHRFMSAGLAEVLRLAETLPDIHEDARRAAENSEQVLAVLREQRAGAGEAGGNSPRPELIAQLGGKTEAELVVQQRVVKVVVQEFPSLAYQAGAIPPRRMGADPKPSAVVFEVVGLDTAVQDSLDVGSLNDSTADVDSAAVAPLEDLVDTQRWVAVEYVPTLEGEIVSQAIEDNFLANGILVVGLDGSAIAAWVGPGSAYPSTLPSALEIDQDWPLERVVRDALRRSFF
jgi:hypothetical protein